MRDSDSTNSNFSMYHSNYPRQLVNVNNVNDNNNGQQNPINIEINSNYTNESNLDNNITFGNIPNKSETNANEEGNFGIHFDDFQKIQMNSNNISQSGYNSFKNENIGTGSMNFVNTSEFNNFQNLSMNENNSFQNNVQSGYNITKNINIGTEATKLMDPNENENNQFGFKYNNSYNPCDTGYDGNNKSLGKHKESRDSSDINPNIQPVKNPYNNGFYENNKKNNNVDNNVLAGNNSNSNTLEKEIKNLIDIMGNFILSQKSINEQLTLSNVKLNDSLQTLTAQQANLSRDIKDLIKTIREQY